MSLLTGDLRQRVLQLLMDVPDVRLAVVRRSLVAGLPDAVRACVGDGPPPAELVNLVDVADSAAWSTLPDGSFSVIRVLENASFNVRGSSLEAEARSILDQLKQHATAVPAPAPPAPAPTTVTPATLPPRRDVRDLHLALLAAFPTKASLDMLVRLRLQTNLDAVAGGENLSADAFNLLVWAEAQGRLDELVTVARTENPGSPELREAAEKLSLAPSSAAPGMRGPTAVASLSFVDTERFLTGMSLSERAVCRLEFGGGFATGFLVGPSAVMTAHYAVSSLHADPSSLRLRFDYATTEDDETVSAGVVYEPAADWLIDSDQDLNFALIRVKGAPGDDAEGGIAGAAPRRWLRPVTDHPFKAGDPLFMIQHPGAGPRKVAFEWNSVVGLADTGPAQVTYRISSAPGSGGSPCFNAEWGLVALHLGRWPENICFGTPISAIAARPAVQAALGT